MSKSRPTTEWAIFRQCHRTFEMKRFTPTVDGNARVFHSHRAVRDWAYDNGIAGQRNSYVTFRQVPRSAAPHTTTDHGV